MPSRRTFLAGTATAAAVALAGCPALSGDSAATSEWHYDPEPRFDATTVAAGTVDLRAALDADLSEDILEGIREVDEETESVDLESVETLVATGFTDVERPITGASVVALGEFDPAAVGEELESDDFEPADSAYDVDRYETDRRAVAIREDALVYGQLVGGDLDGAYESDPVEAALAAEAGDVERFADREGAETVQSELDGDVTAAVEMGAEFRQDVGENLVADGDPLSDIVAATEAFGFDATFDDGTTELNYVLLADEAEIDVETVREFLEDAEGEGDASIENVSVSREGAVIVASATADTASVVESHTTAIFGDPGDDTQNVPQVAFRIERTDDDRIRVVHDGGDAVEQPLTIRYDGADEVWGETPITAGDEFVTDGQPGAETTVRVVWESEDGTSSATLAQATV